MKSLILLILVFFQSQVVFRTTQPGEYLVSELNPASASIQLIYVKPEVVGQLYRCNFISDLMEGILSLN